MSQNEAHENAQAQYIQALRNPALYSPSPAQVELIETHISYVLLAGAYVYKIKKPVNFGFLDFSSLAKRKHYCEEELRLNRRHATDIYLAVVAIGGSLDQPILNATQNIFEYAVKMRRFAQDELFDHVLAQQQIHNDDIDVLAQSLVDFHQNVAVASPSMDYGSFDQVKKYTLENITVVESFLSTEQDKKQLVCYQHWLEDQHQALVPLLLKRQQEGFIRECHGDLHLRNILFSQGKFIFFDCIEFNPALRWIDVISELAFLAMDLAASGHSAFSNRLINQYVELTGDYEGLPLLRYYLAYRAMVRSKVAFLSLSQAKIADQQQAFKQQGLDYLRLACSYVAKAQPALCITHGFSGSGKSWHTLKLLENTGALRLRSDVERKRLYGVRLKEAKTTRLGQSAYDSHSTERVYQGLLKQADLIIKAGYPAIVDATCLRHWQRDLFRRYAEQNRIKFSILHFDASLDELRRRVMLRQTQHNDVSDASLSVLEQQVDTAEAFTEDELPYVVFYDTQAH